jgi:hypothetical protein
LVIVVIVKPDNKPRHCLHFCHISFINIKIKTLLHPLYVPGVPFHHIKLYHSLNLLLWTFLFSVTPVPKLWQVYLEWSDLVWSWGKAWMTQCFAYQLTCNLAVILKHVWKRLWTLNSVWHDCLLET